MAVPGRTVLLTAALLSLAGAPLTAQDIELSTIDNGFGGFAINGQAAGDHSGCSVASAGDVNGDGLADLIVGAYRSNPAAGADAGRAYVIFGRLAGADVDLTDIDNGAGGFVINGEVAGDYAGYSVSSAGDVNGDGLADVIVGANRSDLAAGVDAGRSYVVFGRTATLPDVDLSAVANGTGGFVINGQAAEDLSGSSVASAGDVNGDGLADVIVGARSSDPSSLSNAGRSYVVFGKTSGAAVDLSAIDGTGPTNGSGGFVINGQAADDQSGRSVAGAGDVNGDGLADLIVGAPNGDPSAVSNAGRSYVVFGKTSTADVELSAIDGTSSTNGVGGFVINGQAASDGSGSSVSSAGDVNGDGRADVIVGASSSDPPGAFDGGRSYVVFGKTGTADVDLSAIDNGSGGFVINAQQAQEYAGISVSSAGDVNGDGLADVIVGASFSNPASGSSAGRSYVVFGKTSGDDVQLSAVDNGTGGFAINGQQPQDRSGRRVSAAGDVNGDGLADLIVGAQRSDPVAGADAGRSYVVFSPMAPPASATHRTVVAINITDRQGVGTHRFGDDDTIFPDSRAWVDFDTGTTGVVTATLTRNDFGLGSVTTAQTANVQWQLSTTRIGYSNVAVTVRYTDGELAGLNEATLRLLSAPTVAGPFIAVAGTTHNTGRNEFTGTVTTLPRVFVLADIAAPTVTVTRVEPNPITDDVADFLVVFSEPVAPTFSIADITLTGSLGPDSLVADVIATDPTYLVRVAALPVAEGGTVGITIGTGVADLAGNALAAPVASALYDVDRGRLSCGNLPGDVNKDGVVNVADVTLLSNFIVNGAPPLP